MHRLILDRAPYFANGLSEPWIESGQKEVTLHPEELDANITKTSFELALKRLYGVDISAEEDLEAVGIFATGCWLEMQDLIDTAVESILRHMAPDNVAGLIRLVTTQYYGKPGERILSSAKAMLCRDGWEMPLKLWDNVPADVVKDIIGGDGFFVPGEWDRWILAKRLLDRRLRHKAVEVGFLPEFIKTRPRAPELGVLQIIRYHPTSRVEYSGAIGDTEPEMAHEKWCALYTHPEVEPLLSLLEEGIHYMHLEFEQLMLIRQAKDFFGLQVLPERVVTDAQWMQLELRYKVLSTRDGELDLGLSTAVEASPGNEASVQASRPSSPLLNRSASSSKGKQPVEQPEKILSETGLEAMKSSPSKFFIPSQDCNIVLGGNADPVVTTSSNSQRQSTSTSSLDRSYSELMQFFSGPTTRNRGSAGDSNRPTTSGSASTEKAATQQLRPHSYTQYPPFRFSAEFENPRLLKEKKRVYSRTVFYAGSLWNVYIQKVRSAKTPQLGVYLHRAKVERENEDGVISGLGTGGTNASVTGFGLATGNGASAGNYAGFGGVGERAGTVDEQIGLLEREILVRSGRERRLAKTNTNRSSQTQPDLGTTRHSNDGDDSSGSGESSGPSVPHHLPSRNQKVRRTHSGGVNASLEPQQVSWSFPQSSSLSSPSSSDSEDNGEADDNDVFFDGTPCTIPPPPSIEFDIPGLCGIPPPPTRPRPRKLIVRSASSAGKTPTNANTSSSRDAAGPARDRDPNARAGISRLPTLPPYVDARPAIRTWFKIYSPSKGGRLLSIYESAPDRFNFSQSWGWKSGSLMLDEGFDSPIPDISGLSAEDNNGDPEMPTPERKESLGLGGVKLAQKKRWKSKGEGKLRFMIVIGNV